ncbi:MAG TPA: FHA domain-containing protein [Longimicrobiaceae bacterium]
MLNLIRKFLRPTLREQLEAGVREALRRYADRHTAPSLRVYVSTDLIPSGVDPELWSQDEAEHLRRFSIQWAEDNHVPRAGLRIEMVLLDTKREFAFVKPIGLDQRPQAKEVPTSEPPVATATATRTGASGAALLEVVSGPQQGTQLRVNGEITLGRRASAEVRGLEDRYMSSRHALLRVDKGTLWVTDLDSKNRTYVNDEALAPHQARRTSVGDHIRMGTTTLRVVRIEA